MRRILLRPPLPLIIFIILTLTSCLAGFAIFYNTLITHDRGKYFNLETSHLYVEFPKNWFVFRWEEKNITGNKYGLVLAPLNLRVLMLITIYDENATKTYLTQNNVSDAFSVNMFEIEKLYNLTMKRSSNVRLRFIENGTRIVSGYNMTYSTFIIINGYVDEEGDTHDWTWMFMSSVNDKIVQIAYHGIEMDYDLAYEEFQYILNSTKIKG